MTDEYIKELMKDKTAVYNAGRTDNQFTPNWKKLGLKSQKEAFEYILSFLKREEKHIAERAYGETVVKDGNLNTLLTLTGKDIKRKKEVIR